MTKVVSMMTVLIVFHRDTEKCACLMLKSTCIYFDAINNKLASLKRIQTKGLQLYVEQSKKEKMNCSVYCVITAMQ